MGNLLSQSVQVEHEGKTARVLVPNQNLDLTAAYLQLAEKFELGEGVIITGFVIDPKAGGPTCPFKLWGGLRGGENVRLITVAASIPAHMAPLPPSKMPGGWVREATVSWACLSSQDAATRGAAGATLLEALKKHGFGFVEADDEQHSAWLRTVVASLSFFSKPEEEKWKARRQVANGKFVGFANQKKRQFFQMRTVDREGCFPWPEVGEDGEEFRVAMTGMYGHLGEVARCALRE
eukprot:CAMPEP_0173451840 /NCGR_PEP_ID=MMETSP1357-20121228/47557_1 /TAXON_ID=77926 /ORGANISM="Hemiselmis rufescens, Strain PCC563" /LENGTH=235 /DNA_ID=CAMNT_0014418643 /DNA_START=26 /DNA_END=730 /DNA_ORIENTATION=-